MVIPTNYYCYITYGNISADLNFKIFRISMQIYISVTIFTDSDFASLPTFKSDLESIQLAYRKTIFNKVQKITQKGFKGHFCLPL